MTLEDSTIQSPAGDRFVGRHQALATFQQCAQNGAAKNILYFTAEAGAGKTWLLQKILRQYGPRNAEKIRAVNIIDFFDTQNQTVLGLRMTIRSRLKDLTGREHFKKYDEALRQWAQARTSDDDSNAGVLVGLEERANKLVGLEERANKIFIECCQNVQLPYRVVLLFDTFEFVQQRYLGRWFVSEFLPKVSNFVMVLVGRPPAFPEMPDNVLHVPLGGLAWEDMPDYVLSRNLSVPQDVSPDQLKWVWENTGGNPLRIELWFHYVLNKVREQPNYQTEWLSPVIEQFARPTDEHRILWAMAVLHRRFSVPMLNYLIQSAEYITLPPDQTIESAVKALQGRYFFIKEYPYLESYLLHDEMQRLIEELLKEADSQDEIRDTLYSVIVEDYYDKMIAEAQARGEAVLADELRAEQFGYRLDRCAAKNEMGTEGLKLYHEFLKQVDESREYDVEELLWHEMQAHRNELPNHGYEVFHARSEWLLDRALFKKAEQHLVAMRSRFIQKYVPISENLGFALYRQSKFEDAIKIYAETRLLADKDPQYSDKVPWLDKDLGMVTNASGQWDEALKYYQRGFQGFLDRDDDYGLASICTNRGFLYALQGNYPEAIKECKRAIARIESLPPARRDDPLVKRTLAYANMNLGTAYRHYSEYDQAVPYYETSLTLSHELDAPDLITNALQHAGLNATLQGAHHRRRNRPTEAIQCLFSGWEQIAAGITTAHAVNYRFGLMHGFRRMARAYHEAYQTRELFKDQADKAVRDQVDQIDGILCNFRPPLEVEYEHQFIIPRLFAESNLLEQAARLYELSSLMAEEVHAYRDALEARISFATLLIDLHIYEAVPGVVTQVQSSQGSLYQHDLFKVMGDYVLASLDFDQGRYDEAIARYADVFIALGSLAGYPAYIRHDRREALRMRLLRLPRDLRKRYGRALSARWVELDTRYPDLAGMIEDIELDRN